MSIRWIISLSLISIYIIILIKINIRNFNVESTFKEKINELMNYLINKLALFMHFPKKEYIKETKINKIIHNSFNNFESEHNKN